MAACIFDQRENIIFPDTEEDIKMVVEENMVKVVKITNHRTGWRVNYSLHWWSQDNYSRR